MEPIVVTTPNLSRHPSKGMAPFDECTMTRNATGHQSFLDSIADIDKNNNINTPKHNSSSCCSAYDPVKYLSAITEHTIFGHSPGQSSPISSPVKNDSACESLPLMYRNSPHPFIQSDELICSWTESNCNIINHINDTNNNNNVTYHNDTMMDSDSSKNISQVPSSNLNSSWRLSPTSPLHPSSSPFSMSLTVSSASLSSSCMQMQTLTTGAIDVLSDPTQSPSSDCSSKTNLTMSNPNLYRQTTFLPPSSPDYTTQPSFLGPTRASSFFNVPCEKDGDIWEHKELEEETNGIMSWRVKHPYHWGSGDVLDWIFSVSVEHGMNMKDLRAENFQNVDGSELCRMKLHDFLQLEPKFGAFMYEMLERLMCKEETNGIISWRVKHPYHWGSGDVLDWIFSVSVEHGLDMKDLRAENFQNVDGSELCRMKLHDFLQLEPKFGAFMYEMLERLMCKAPRIPSEAHYTLNSVHSPGFKPEPQDYHQGQIQETSQIFTIMKPEEGGQSYYNDCYNQQCQSPFPSPIGHACCSTNTALPSQVLRRRSGRPRARNIHLDVRDSKDKKAKNQHLWEFIYETLMSPSHNPQFLRWENQREGIFRFVQSEAVAQLWGRRKNNDNMTYEKLSRAMRHYYRRGILERVEGRRLVYKFSVKAMERIKNKKNASNP